MADATNNLLMVPGASRQQQDFLGHLEIGLQVDHTKHFWLFWCTAVMKVASWRRRYPSPHPANEGTILIYQPSLQRRQQQGCAIAQICISAGSQHFSSQSSSSSFSRGWSSLNAAWSVKCSSCALAEGAQPPWLPPSPAQLLYFLEARLISVQTAPKSSESETLRAFVDLGSPLEPAGSWAVGQAVG